MPKPTKGPRLGGSPAHQRIILDNLASQLFEHGRIRTTEARAKRVRPLAEKLITKAKRGDLHSVRLAAKHVRDKDVLWTLFHEIAPVMEGRDGGYTRIVKLAPRKGDNAPMALLEVIEEKVEPKAKPGAAAPAAEAPAAAGDAPAADAKDYGEGSYRGDEAPEGFDIKGNEDSMKYHTPESPWYSSTTAEVWFNSAEAAEAAGFAPAVKPAGGADDVGQAEEIEVTEAEVEAADADATEATAADEAAAETAEDDKEA